MNIDEREINSTVIQLAYDNKYTLYAIDNSGTISAIDIRSLDKLWSKNIDINVTSGLCYHDEKLFFGSNIGKLYGYSINDLNVGSGFIDSINLFVPDLAIVPRLSINSCLFIPMPLSSISIIFFFFETLMLIFKSLSASNCNCSKSIIYSI